MAKIPTNYYLIDPWKIVESGFDLTRNEVSESIFSLANEYMGVRGYAEEGGSAPTLRGSYFNGIYEIAPDNSAPHYKGIVRKTHFMVNAADWLYTRIEVDGEVLDTGISAISGFRRELDFRTGVLERTFIWTLKSGKRVRLSFKRFLDMTRYTHGYQRIFIEALDTGCNVVVVSGIDLSLPHTGFGGKNHWNTMKNTADGNNGVIVGRTVTTEQQIASAFTIAVSGAKTTACPVVSDKLCAIKSEFRLQQGKPVIFDKTVVNIVERDNISQPELLAAGAVSERADAACFDKALEDTCAFWSRVWREHDIEIEGDAKNQQGIRYCIFQLCQTYHGAVDGDNIGAKGLTGEAYSGHAFWDTETYCLPFYLFGDAEAARSLLMFRYKTLEPARLRAAELDCRGACYPIATLNGMEGCTLWQHASLQFQPSTGVAFGIQHYCTVTGDKEFLHTYGAEMLVEISRFLLSRGQWNARGNKFGYYCVMGPDEFQMMVNHNCYTNFMAKKTLEYTIEVLEEMRREDPQQYSALEMRIGFGNDEIDAFKSAAGAMYIPYDTESCVFEQHDGYFDLPHIDPDLIPPEEFPLYSHWAYDRIYRNDMIKQPDVLMFMFLYASGFTFEQKKANYEYYEPRCIHESSLSPSVHSCLAAELGKLDEAEAFFGFATRMDIDDYNRNTREGLHMTSIAAAWINIVYGFGGLRSDSPILRLAPTLPPSWSGYSFRFRYKNTTVKVRVDKSGCTVEKVDGQGFEFILNGEKTTI